MVAYGAGALTRECVRQIGDLGLLQSHSSLCGLGACMDKDSFGTRSSFQQIGGNKNSQRKMKGTLREIHVIKEEDIWIYLDVEVERSEQHL